MKTKTLLFSLSSVLAPAYGGFVLIDDFEGLTPGPLSGQNDWVADVDYTVAADPSGGANQVMQYLFGAQGGAYRALGDLAVAEGEVATLFYRFRFDSEGNANTGFSDVAAPAGYGDFEAQVNRQANTPIKGRDGALFQDLSYSDPAILADEVDVWYSIWIVADNDSDTSKIYLQSNDDPDFLTQTEVSTPDGMIEFRNGTDLPLSTLMIRSQQGMAFWDDIYLSAGEDLGNPAPVTGGIDGIRITDLQYLDGSSLEITWTAISGHEYAIETSGDLTVWAALADTVIADSASASTELFDAEIAPVNGRLFFRIQDLGVPAR